jgi:hypothetical protein
MSLAPRCPFAGELARPALILSLTHLFHMTCLPTPTLSADDLRALASQGQSPSCRSCKSLPSAGWEAVPTSLDRQGLEQIGALFAPDADLSSATLDELHPQGTRYWSPDAPIATAWFPYNRCTVWRCRACGTLLLRYAETGGYFEEERIRRVDPDLIVRTPGNT